MSQSQTQSHINILKYYLRQKYKNLNIDLQTQKRWRYKTFRFFFSLRFWYTNNSCVQVRRNSFVRLYVL